MRRYFKLIVFLAVSFFFLIVVSLFQVVWLVVRYRRGAVLAWFTHLWAKSLLMILGIRVEKSFHHRQLYPRHHLIVSNHQSYLDVIVIASLFPTVFVAKKEVKQWPLLGWLASLGGTVFIDRQAFRGGMRSSQEVSAVLTRGENVCLFPEGTSSDGTTVLPFKPSLLKAAIDARASVLPLSINYLLVNGKPISYQVRETVCWYGAMDFLPHFWNLLSTSSLLCTVITHRSVTPSLATTAQELARQCFDAVSSGVLLAGEITPQQQILFQEFSTPAI